MSYTSVSTIGSYCQAAYQLRRAARNVVSGPLDWVFIDFKNVLMCLDHDFDGLCEWRNLFISADLDRVKDIAFGVTFYHAFPRDDQHQIPVYDLKDAYAAYRPKLDHLVANYRAIGGHHLFVWAIDYWFREGVHAHDAAKAVLTSLRRRKPECDLLVVQADAEPEPDWGNGLINRYTANTPGKWQGDDASWNDIFAELGIAKHPGAAV